MLVGGPGNGKSDAIDGCISRFDQKLNADGALIKSFTEAFTCDPNSLPPRRVEVPIGQISCGKLPKDLRIGLFRTLRKVPKIILLKLPYWRKLHLLQKAR